MRLRLGVGLFLFYAPFTCDATHHAAEIHETMLKIYDKKEDVPETDKEFFDKHYKQRADGKWEPQIEGINSIGGVLTKNSELTDEINNKLKPRLRELEGKEVLTDGKIAVDKEEFNSMKTENDSYKALGSLDEITPKVTGFDGLSAKVKNDTRDKALMSFGVNIKDAQKLVDYQNLDIESETKDGKEVFYRYTTDDKGVRTKGEEFNAESLKSDAFKDTLGSLTSGVPYPQQQRQTITNSSPVDTTMAKYTPPASAAVK